MDDYVSLHPEHTRTSELKLLLFFLCHHNLYLDHRPISFQSCCFLLLADLLDVSFVSHPNQTIDQKCPFLEKQKKPTCNL